VNIRKEEAELLRRAIDFLEMAATHKGLEEAFVIALELDSGLKQAIIDGKVPTARKCYRVRATLEHLTDKQVAERIILLHRGQAARQKRLSDPRER
jgi:hypothetical protein